MVRFLLMEWFRNSTVLRFVQYERSEEEISVDQENGVITISTGESPQLEKKRIDGFMTFSQTVI